MIKKYKNLAIGILTNRKRLRIFISIILACSLVFLPYTFNKEKRANAQAVAGGLSAAELIYVGAGILIALGLYATLRAQGFTHDIAYDRAAKKLAEIASIPIDFAKGLLASEISQQTLQYYPGEYYEITVGTGELATTYKIFTPMPDVLAVPIQMPVPLTALPLPQNTLPPVPPDPNIETLSRIFATPVMMAINQAMMQLYAKYGIDLSVASKPGAMPAIEDKIAALSLNPDFVRELNDLVAVFNNAILNLYRTSILPLVQPMADWLQKVKFCMSNEDFKKLLLAGFGNSWAPPIGIGTAVYTMFDTSINYLKDGNGAMDNLATSGLYIAISGYFVYHMINGYRRMLYPPGQKMLERIRACISTGNPEEAAAIDPDWISGGFSNLQLNIGMAGFLLLTKTILKDVGAASVDIPINQVPINISPVFTVEGRSISGIPNEVYKIEIELRNHEMIMRTEYGDIKLPRFSIKKIRGDEDFFKPFSLNFAKGAVTAVYIRAYSCIEGNPDDCSSWQLKYEGSITKFSTDMAQNGNVELILKPAN